eukprot:s44_g30.t1
MGKTAPESSYNLSSTETDGGNKDQQRLICVGMVVRDGWCAMHFDAKWCDRKWSAYVWLNWPGASNVWWSRTKRPVQNL